MFDFARVVYDDIVNYKKNGLNGLINDCSQRSFFPNGFAFYIYGQLQFDTSLTFDELKEVRTGKRSRRYLRSSVRQ